MAVIFPPQIPANRTRKVTVGTTESVRETFPSTTEAVRVLASIPVLTAVGGADIVALTDASGGQTVGAPVPAGVLVDIPLAADKLSLALRSESGEATVYLTPLASARV